MTPSTLRAALCAAALVLSGAAPTLAQEPSLSERLDAIDRGLDGVARAAAAGDSARARADATRLYLDHLEPIEGWYGPGAGHGAPGLAPRVAEAETAFHALLAADGTELAAAVEAARRAARAIGPAARAAGVPERPGALPVPVVRATGGTARTPEIAAILAELDRAEAAWRAGDRAAALAGVERAYLEGLEPLEPRLPAEGVARAERLVHLTLRPRLAHDASGEEIGPAFAALDAALLDLDRDLAGGASFWFGAVSAFLIVFREGLEAVLLVGAILAWLARTADGRRRARAVWGGVAAGLAASLATWVAAQTVVTVSGASRELIEGVTALLAVAVLLYVSHWLFQKTYLQDWREYLKGKVDEASASGSTLALAGLAFAAVYREGFETVLFYQALAMDAGPGPVLAGFLPGLAAIALVGAGILRIGLRLPLRRVFAWTNAVLIAIAFVFLGKGIWNLQEAGIFAAHPIAGFPDHPLLRQALGIYPIAESLLAQAALLAALAALALVHRGRARSRAGAPAPAGSQTPVR